MFVSTGERDSTRRLLVVLLTIAVIVLLVTARSFYLLLVPRTVATGKHAKHRHGKRRPTDRLTGRDLTPVPLVNMSGAEHVERLRNITSGREYGTPPEPEGPPTPSPLARGTRPCRVRTPPLDLDHTGKRALVLYSITHRDQGPVHSMEMDNFAFFAQHGLFPSSLRTALFTQVDYVVVRVAATDGRIHDHTRDLNSTNVKILVLPTGPCDICSMARTLKYLGVDQHSSKYAYIVSVNSGSRGPFFTVPPRRSRGREPYTWIDHMALGGENQFSETVITAAASSMQWITHFQTYAFGLSTPALKTMGPFFARTCDFPIKEGCIYLGEILSARVAFNASLHVRSLIHHPTRAFSDEDTFTQFINATGLQSPLLARVVKPCQMLFVKFGGDTFEHSRFQKQYVETMLAQTIAQVKVAKRVPVSEDATHLFGRAYFSDPGV